MADWMSELKEFAMSLVVGHGDYLPISNDIFRLIIKHGWHPVSEKPIKEGRYIVTCNFVNIKRSDIVIDWFDGQHFDHSNIVLAWMPLPEPYDQKNCIERVDK